jgi:hypothetical protein
MEWAGDREKAREREEHEVDTYLLYNGLGKGLTHDGSRRRSGS